VAGTEFVARLIVMLYITLTRPACDAPGLPRRLRQHGVHGHKSPWKKFEWHVKPQYMVERLVEKHTAHLRMDHGVTTYVGFKNANNLTSSPAALYTFQESGLASEFGGLAALGGLIDVRPPAASGMNFEAIPHIGAPSATLAQAAAADREIVFPVCEAEPMACTDACMYRVELVMKRCMAWLHVSGTRTGSGARERSANTKVAACQSALTSARGECDAAEHADCLHPIAHNFEALLATHHRPIVS
jgi:hypothetical protein